MLGRVVVENGVKKIVPLTADCGSGNPCGAIITVYQRTVPNGYLPLGAQYDITQFPVLYSILGTDTIPTASALGLPTLTTGQYVIKATSGINENQADNVLNILQPVDVVAVDNLHSVTSNAVAGALAGKANAVSDDNILSIASLEVTSGIGNKNQYVSSITLPAGSRYLVFFSQSSNISDTARMDGTYVSDAGEFSVVPNSTMEQGAGSVRIAYYKSSSNDRVIRYGLGYKYNSTACTFTWRVNAIRLA